MFGLLACFATLAAMGVHKRERSVAAVVGLMLLINWGLTISAWGPNSPAGLFTRLGIEAGHVDAWSVADACVAMTIVPIAGEYRWGRAIFAFTCAKVGLHIGYQYAGLEYARYSLALDFLFLSELAVLVFIGRRGCVDMVLRGARLLRRAHRPSASQAARERR